MNNLLNYNCYRIFISLYEYTFIFSIEIIKIYFQHEYKNILTKRCIETK